MTQPPAAVTPSTIAFIGGGNMARSLICGLIARGTPASAIRVAEPVRELREALAQDYGVAVFDDNAIAVDGAAIWLLAAKPQVMRAICEALASQASAQRPLVISIAAGITITQLARWLDGDNAGATAPAIVRCMPNTPALLGAGVTGLYANAQVDAAGHARAEALLSSVGHTVWIDDEALMDAVTGVSGSGPAYVFLLAEAMEQAALAQGLPGDAARILVQQTLLGAARMLVESGEAPAELRRRVTSPDGTTQAAIEAFEAGGLRTLVADAIHAATTRGAQLSAAND
ncbi:MAG: pyrroline-5-carboxylate reductase [Luteimonas sp.]|nr:pyrroline-5-carboxylate reductase [Luteimonas sp.]